MSRYLKTLLSRSTKPDSAEPDAVPDDITIVDNYPRLLAYKYTQIVQAFYNLAIRRIREVSTRQSTATQVLTKPATDTLTPPDHKLGRQTRDKLARLGLMRDLDLVLHMPILYEGEIRLTLISKLLPGMTAQVSGKVVDNKIIYRPRRQMLVQVRDKDGDVLILRFLKFRDSQTKQLVPSACLRVRSDDVRVGFYGIEVVHPAYHIIKKDAPLPVVLTPIYPSTTGVSQAYLRHAINSALQRTLLPEPLPPQIVKIFLALRPVPPLAHAVRILHNPRADMYEAIFINRTHPAWLRIKFEELLA